MAAVDWFAQAEVAEPVPAPRRRRVAAQRPAAPVRSRRKPVPRRVRAHIVLRAHVAVTHLDEQRAQLQAQNQALASHLSAVNSAPRIEAAARRLGMVPAPAANTSYFVLPSGRR